MPPSCCAPRPATCGPRRRSSRTAGTTSRANWSPTGRAGVLFLAGLLRRYYRWVFYPVRDLTAGAGRVAAGDFAHRIEVHSGDEFEDLAAAFNDMTHRLDSMYADLARQVNERSRQL